MRFWTAAVFDLRGTLVMSPRSSRSCGKTSCSPQVATAPRMKATISQVAPQPFCPSIAGTSNENDTAASITPPAAPSMAFSTRSLGWRNRKKAERPEDCCCACDDGGRDSSSAHVTRTVPCL